MKKYAIITAVLVLTLSLLTGCGCTAQDSDVVTMPATEDRIPPTNIPETTAPTRPATEPATVPPADLPDMSDDTGIGNTGEAATDGSMQENRNRMR